MDDEKSKRYAFEWYVKKMDRFYFSICNRKVKKATQIAIASLSAFAGLGIILLICIIRIKNKFVYILERIEQ